MADCVILIPVLNRPDAAAVVHKTLTAVTPKGRALFICTPGDDAELTAVKATGADFVIAPFDRRPGDYARKINLGIDLTDEPLIFLGADDLRFHNGWLELAMRQLRGRIGVVGTNDMGNRRVRSGQHSTHSLLSREYVLEHGTIDEPGKALHEGYDHNFVDDELVATAKLRRAWGFAGSAKVEHLHFHWKKGLGNDTTYQLGLRRFERDRALFNQRSQLWKQRGRR